MSSLSAISSSSALALLAYSASSRAQTAGSPSQRATLSELTAGLAVQANSSSNPSSTPDASARAFIQQITVNSNDLVDGVFQPPTVDINFSVSHGVVKTTAVGNAIGENELSQGTLALAGITLSNLDAITQEYMKTDAQVSADVYSGGILETTTVGQSYSGTKDTFQLEVALNESIANYQSAYGSMLSQWLAEGRPEGQFASNGVYMTSDFVQNLNVNFSDAQIKNMIAQSRASAASTHETDAEITQAFNSHTLNIEKATDAAGLDYRYNATWNVFSLGETGSGSADVYNPAALATSADGTQHTLMHIAGVALYLSWNESESA